MDNLALFRILAEAHASGIAEGKRTTKKLDNDQEEDPDPFPDDYDDNPDNEGDDSPTKPNDGKRKKSKKAKPVDADETDEETVAMTADEIRARAAAVVFMGKVRRGEVAHHDEPAPPIKDLDDYPPGYQGRVESAARRILNAGCKRRGQPERF